MHVRDIVEAGKDGGVIIGYVGQGGKVIATYETSRYDEEGNMRHELLIGRALGTRLDSHGIAQAARTVAFRMGT